MTFWEARAAAKENIRLFEAAKTWRRYADEVDATTGETKTRCVSGDRRVFAEWPECHEPIAAHGGGLILLRRERSRV